MKRRTKLSILTILVLAIGVCLVFVGPTVWKKATTPRRSWKISADRETVQLVEEREWGQPERERWVWFLDTGTLQGRGYRDDKYMAAAWWDRTGRRLNLTGGGTPPAPDWFNEERLSHDAPTLPHWLREWAEAELAKQGKQ